MAVVAAQGRCPGSRRGSARQPADEAADVAAVDGAPCAAELAGAEGVPDVHESAHVERVIVECVHLRGIEYGCLTIVIAPLAFVRY